MVQIGMRRKNALSEREPTAFLLFREHSIKTVLRVTIPWGGGGGGLSKKIAGVWDQTKNDQKHQFQKAPFQEANF